MRYISTLLAGFFLITPFVSHAEAVPLTLEAAVDLAVRHSAELAKSAIDVAIARSAADNLWSQIFSTNVSAAAGYSVSTAGFPSVSGAPDGRAEAGLSAAVTVDIGLGLGAKLKTLVFACQSETLRYEAAKNQIENAAAKSYYGLLVRQKNLFVLRDKLRQAEDQLDADRIKFQNGFISALNLQRGVLSVETAKYGYNRAKLDYDENKSAFLSLIGLTHGSEVELTGDFQIRRLLPDAAARVSGCLARRTDVSLAVRAVETAALNTRYTALQNRGPLLSLSAGWEGRPLPAGGFSSAAQAGVGVKISFDSWIPGGKSSQTINAAYGAVEKARLDLENTRRNAENTVRILIDTIGTLWHGVHIARLRAEIAEKTYDMVETAFNNGIEGFLALESARNDLALSRWELLNEELSYHNACLDLGTALNTSLSELWTLFTDR
jgi:outer membrane protein TolC